MLLDAEYRVICRVKNKEITKKALKAIKVLNASIRMRAANEEYMEFAITDPISENHRIVWENIILGIIAVY